MRSEVGSIELREKTYNDFFIDTTYIYKANWKRTIY